MTDFKKAISTSSHAVTGQNSVITKKCPTRNFHIPPPPPNRPLPLSSGLCNLPNSSPAFHRDLPFIPTRHPPRGSMKARSSSLNPDPPPDCAGGHHCDPHLTNS
nr:hypothetical protein CFP56_16914 [Quercus suber]